MIEILRTASYFKIDRKQVSEWIKNEENSKERTKMNVAEKQNTVPSFREEASKRI